MDDQHIESLSQSGKQPFDSTFKDWISQQAATILPLLLPGASYETTLNVELIRPAMRVDKAFQVVYDGGKCIVHVEFQTSYDRHFHARLLVYNAMLYHDYKLPVITLVVYPFQVTTARSPLRIQTLLQKKTLVTFHFQRLLLFKIDAWNVIQQRHTCLYPLLPTMKGVQEDLIMQAMEELIAHYHHDNVTLSQQFVWMRLLVERSSTIPNKKKDHIQRRLSMFDQLWEESKMVKQMREQIREEYFEKGIEKGVEKGTVKTFQDMLLQYVEIRFPTLVALAKNLIGQPYSGEHFQSLLTQLYRARTLEEAQAVLLQG